MWNKERKNLNLTSESSVAKQSLIDKSFSTVYCEATVELNDQRCVDEPSLLCSQRAALSSLDARVLVITAATSTAVVVIDVGWFDCFELKNK